jgi:hypothetical protein
MNWIITIDFSPEELEAVVNLVEYASKDIDLDDEPLRDRVYNKLKVNLLEREPWIPMEKWDKLIINWEKCIIKDVYSI